MRSKRRWRIADQDQTFSRRLEEPRRTAGVFTMIPKHKKLLQQRNVSHRLVLVEWEDSRRPLAAWGWLDEYVFPDAVQCISVGFLIAESKNSIALAPNLGDTNQPRASVRGDLHPEQRDSPHR